MNPINSHNNQHIKALMKLSKKKYRDSSQVLLIEGDHLIQEARSANLLHEVLGVHKGDTLISESVAEKLSTTKSGSEVFGVITKPVYTLNRGWRYLILDGVQDPGNVGTLIRSAHSFGFDLVIVSKDSADIYSDKTIRSSQGALFHIPVVQMDLEAAIKTLKTFGVSIVASHVESGTQTLEALNTNRKLAIVLGSEGQGVRESICALSDEGVHIETSNFESLNVGVAGSIIAYHLRK